MIYRFPITTPSNTLITAKKETRLKLWRGVIHHLDILFPPGPQGYLKLQIYDGTHQVWPTTTGQHFSTDGETISFHEHYEIIHPPYELIAWTWNLDDTYAHILYIRIGILKRKYTLRRIF